jgi:hypothetical protein
VIIDPAHYKSKGLSRPLFYFAQRVVSAVSPDWVMTSSEYFHPALDRDSETLRA